MKKLFCLLIITSILLPYQAFASSPASAHFTLQDYGLGAGGTDTNTTSTSYKLFGTAGETEFGKTTSAQYGAGTGLNFLLKLNVPPSPTLSNPGNTYDRLQIVVNQGSNASDVLYAISISTSSTFASNVNYVKAGNTMGTTLTTSDYNAYTGWGGSSGIFVSGLSPNTTYYVRARARISKFSETEWGPISTGIATANPTLTFSTNNSSITFTTLTPGNSYTDSSQSTVLQTTTNAYNGYVIYAKETKPLTSGINTISDYTGTNTNPTSWSGNGFGYTTNDNNLTVGPGTPTRFNNGTNYAGFPSSSASPGDPVANHLGPIQSAQITNEQFTVSYKVVGTNATPPGTYNNVILYTVMATY